MARKFWIGLKKYEVFSEELVKEYDAVKKEEQLEQFVSKNKLKVVAEADPHAQGNAQKGIVTISADRLAKFEDLVNKQQTLIDQLLAEQGSKKKPDSNPK